MKSYIEVALAACLWGTTGFFVRMLSSAGFNNFQMVAFRVLIAVACLAIIMLIKDRSLFRFRLRDIWCFIGSGVVSHLIFNLCYFQSMKEAPLSVCAVLLYVSPAFVVVLSAVLFKERLTVVKITAILVMMLGCVFVTGVINGIGSFPVSGLYLGLGAALAYALYSIFSRFAINKGYRPLTITFYTFVFAGAGLLPFTDFAGIFSAEHYSSWLMIACVPLIGIVNCLLPYLLYTSGLVKLENGVAAVLSTLELIVATLISVFVFQEPFTEWTAIGIVLILAGIVMINIKFKKTGKFIHIHK